MAGARAGVTFGGMAVGAYMVSILRRQWLLLGPRFLREHPHCWLVWEPGPWRPASSVEMANQARTLEPGTEAPCRPGGEDAICFELPHLPGPGPLKGGRAAGSDISINDVTVSREQFELVTVGQRWHLAVTRPGVSVTPSTGSPAAASR